MGLLLMTGNNRLKDVNNMSKDAIELENQFAKSNTKSAISAHSMPKTPVARRRDRAETQSIAMTGSNTDFGDLAEPGLLRKDSDLSNLLVMSQHSDIVKFNKIKQSLGPMSKISSSSSSKNSK